MAFSWKPYRTVTLVSPLSHEEIQERLHEEIMPIREVRGFAAVTSERAFKGVVTPDHFSMQSMSNNQVAALQGRIAPGESGYIIQATTRIPAIWFVFFGIWIAAITSVIVLGTRVDGHFDPFAFLVPVFYAAMLYAVLFVSHHQESRLLIRFLTRLLEARETSMREVQ